MPPNRANGVVAIFGTTLLYVTLMIRYSSEITAQKWQDCPDISHSLLYEQRDTNPRLYAYGTSMRIRVADQGPVVQNKDVVS